MNKKLTSAAVLALAALATPVVLAAPKPDQQLSIERSAAVVKFGQELTVSGQLTGGTARDISARTALDISGQNITLRADTFPYEGQFAKVATVDTNDSGAYSFTLKPEANAQYQTTAKGGVESPQLLVEVRVAVALAVADTSPQAGDRVEFSGTVAPAHDGRKAKIQRRTGDGWKTVKKVTLADAGDAFSNFSSKVRIRRSARYRVKFRPGDGDHLSGKSTVTRVRVG